MEKCECVSSIMTMAPVLHIEREPMGPLGILMRIDDGVYVWICNVYFNVLKNHTQHAFVYESYSSKKVKSAFWGAIIDNRTYEPICVLEGKYRETKKNWRICLGNYFKACALWIFHSKLLHMTLHDI